MTILTLTKPPKARRTVTSAQPRRKKTVLLDGLELAAIVHARSAKKAKRKVGASAHLKPKTKTPNPPKGIGQIDTLGVFASRSTAEDVLVIRSWMQLRGLKPIDELFTISEFASCFERYVRQRHAWTHFSEFEAPRAKRFLAEMAQKLLPEILAPGDAR